MLVQRGPRGPFWCSLPDRVRVAPNLRAHHLPKWEEIGGPHGTQPGAGSTSPLYCKRQADVTFADPGALAGITASDAVLQAGARLDEHHASETNGRMAVCRRCGARTDGPDGRHAPSERQLPQINHWLEVQALSMRIAGAARGRDT